MTEAERLALAIKAIPKEEVDTRVIVVEKATGGLISILSEKDFNPLYHARYVRKPSLDEINEAREKKRRELEELDALEKQISVEKNVAPDEKEEESKEPVVLPEKSPELEARFKELKGLVAWKKPELKEEYYLLKAVYEPKK